MYFHLGKQNVLAFINDWHFWSLSGEGIMVKLFKAYLMKKYSREVRVSPSVRSVVMLLHRLGCRRDGRSTASPLKQTARERNLPNLLPKLYFFCHILSPAVLPCDSPTHRKRKCKQQNKTKKKGIWSAIAPFFKSVIKGILRFIYSPTLLLSFCLICTLSNLSHGPWLHQFISNWATSSHKVLFCWSLNAKSNQ